ncbi:hypothetical protein GCM10027168_44280 [Streptomyces capparidis]
MNIHDIQQNPDEHVRFAAYLDKLENIPDPDEVELVSLVLTDPDQTMAQSAVLRHLDRRAADLHPGPAYEGWARTMAQATIGYPFLTQRLREWSLFRSVTLNLSWQPDDLLASSNWLQLKTASGTNTEAVELLAETGRTKRIRNTAKANLRHQRELNHFIHNSRLVGSARSAAVPGGEPQPPPDRRPVQPGPPSSCTSVAARGTRDWNSQHTAAVGDRAIAPEVRIGKPRPDRLIGSTRCAQVPTGSLAAPRGRVRAAAEVPDLLENPVPV